MKGMHSVGAHSKTVSRTDSAYRPMNRGMKAHNSKVGRPDLYGVSSAGRAGFVNTSKNHS